MRKLMLSAAAAIVIILSGAAAFAQDTPDSMPLGGPLDPLGVGGEGTADTGAAKPARAPSAPVYLSGSGPINLRPGAYVSHQGEMQQPAVTPTEEPWPPAPPTGNSAAAYNKALSDSKNNTNNTVAPSWGVYNE
ncbi:MAG: hypothetical protein KGQ41_05685 [Alphaproteobacteria bacterium]|nr:hypothetical protein [Alphaproteobacteria bacterium]